MATQNVEGPSIWRTAPINLRTFAALLGVSVPGAPNGLPELGVDYIPPLNAKADIRVSVKPPITPTEALALGFHEIPDYFSWNDPESVQTVQILPPPSQFGCGACWAFAITTALSDRYAIFTGPGAIAQNPNLSPSYLLACMSPESRCNGGYPSEGGKFLEQQGTVSEGCYDYTWCTSDPDCLHGNGSSAATDLNRTVPQCNGSACAHDCSVNPRGFASQCDSTGKFALYRAKRDSTQALTDRRSIQLDILQNGPVAAVGRIFGDFIAGTMVSAIFPKADHFYRTRTVYVHITGKDIYGYGRIDCLGAQQDAHECFMGNHAMVIVGWGIERGIPNFLKENGVLDIPYWIVRNSWGTQWNGNGYCRIAMSDPDTGINMALGFDRPIRIGGKDFGAVTTILPDIPNNSPRPGTGIRTSTGTGIQSNAATTSPGSSKVRYIYTVNLDVIFGILFFVGVLVGLYFIFKKMHLKNSLEN